MSETFNIKHFAEIRQIVQKARLHNDGIEVLHEWQIFNLQSRQRELLRLLEEDVIREKRQHLSLIINNKEKKQ